MLARRDSTRRNCFNRSEAECNLLKCDSPTPDFKPRPILCAKLQSNLIEEAGLAILQGIAGTGKLELAIHFPHQCATSGIVRQFCGEHADLDEISAELARKLDLHAAKLAPNEPLGRVRAWFATRRSQLILDDVWDDELLKT